MKRKEKREGREDREERREKREERSEKREEREQRREGRRGTREELREETRLGKVIVATARQGIGKERPGKARRVKATHSQGNNGNEREGKAREGNETPQGAKVWRERTNEKLVVRGFVFPLDTPEIHHWDSILMVIELCRGGGE